MSKTKNIGLELTPEISDKTFKEYRTGLDGENDSNMIKIDDKFGEVDDNVKNIKTKTEMDELYLPQRTDNGVMPSLDCVIDSNAINYQIWGNSYQKTGKNLFNMNISEPYKTGIISIDGNSIVYNGAWYILNKINLKAGTTITCSFNMSGYDDTVSISNKWRVQYSDSSYSDTIESGTSLLLSKDMMNLIIYVSQGATVTATISNIQLELGSKATPYEPYIEMPSPEHPSEIQSVGDKSKNLLKVSITPTTMGGVTLSKVDDYYVLNGIATGSGNFTSSKMDIEEGIYTFSANNNECSHIDYPIIQLYDDIIEKTMNVLDNKVNNFTTGTIQKGSYHFRIRIEKGITYENYIIKPQLELGNVVTSYEPYGYKIPISICGKNLIPYPYVNTSKTVNGITFTDNDDGTITANGTATGKAIFHFYSQDIPISSQLILSGGPKGGSYTTYFIECRCKKPDNTEMYPKDIGETVSIPTSYGVIKDIYIVIMQGVTVNNLIFKPQLEKGSIVTDYESYKEETVNIYLNEPLRKIDDFADYIDFKKGKVIRNIDEVTFYGIEKWEDYISEANAVTLPITHLSNSSILCDYGTYINEVNWANDSYILFRVSKFKISTVAEWKQYVSNNPITVSYCAITSTEEPITLQPLHLQDGINNIISNTTIQPSNIQINYYQNLTDLINKIKQAIISGGGNV